MKTRIVAPLGAVALAALTISSAVAADWPLFNGDAGRSGVVRGESMITPLSVHRLHRVWEIKLDSSSETSPVAAGGRLYVTTRAGVTYAIEESNGEIDWRFSTHGPGYTTAAPAVDASAGVVYVPALDGFIHELSLSTGTESTGQGFPVRLTFQPDLDKDASPFNLSTGHLYAVTSAYLGDIGNFEGHLAVIRLRDGRERVVNAECANVKVLLRRGQCPDIQGGIWARAGAVIDPDPSMGGRVYVTTGNGKMNAFHGGNGYGDAVIAVSSDGAAILDFYTPSNFKQLDTDDMDLGSTAPVMLPRQPRSGTPLLAVQGGKDGVLHLLNRKHLGGVGGALQDYPIGEGVYSAPAVWTDPHGSTWVFVGTASAMRGLRILTDASGSSTIRAGWMVGVGGTSPVIANGLVFVAASGTLRALDALTGSLRWQTSIGAIHWQSPIVIDGRVFISDESGRLTAFGL
jgi:outer membrane protein assembly factor BamB